MYIKHKYCIQRGNALKPWREWSNNTVCVIYVVDGMYGLLDAVLGGYGMFFIGWFSTF